MRFSGAVGYATNEETAPGVWTEGITEVTYFGDVVRSSRRLEPRGGDYPPLTDDIALGNSFSIVADAYATEHIFAMRYVKWQGSNWKITNVDVQRPRLILTVGELWNGDTP
jgi:hypothetical protein